MKKDEAIRILDEVIPPPEHHTVDLDHLRIAQAWQCIKEELTAEPIVRCGECKWANSRGECAYNGKEAEDIKMCYCSYGERKDEVDNG